MHKNHQLADRSNDCRERELRNAADQKNSGRSGEAGKGFTSLMKRITSGRGELAGVKQPRREKT